MGVKGIGHRLLKLTGGDNVMYGVALARSLRRVAELMQLEGHQLQQFQQQRLALVPVLWERHAGLRQQCAEFAELSFGTRLAQARRQLVIVGHPHRHVPDLDGVVQRLLSKKLAILEAYDCAESVRPVHHRLAPAEPPPGGLGAPLC